eukprot:TCALIF_08538-PA protein Name:"Similar to GDA Guanine deaminase (Pongo abelii)" AED:0.14 eAED:0.16 QI:0/0.6/0.5/0.83/0.8/0.66/6/0/417
MVSMSPKLIIGTIVDSNADWSLRIRENHCIIIDDNGTIVMEGPFSSQAVQQWKDKYSVTEVVELDREEFLLPGFIDSHIHASQLPNCGLALDLPLLKWLQTYTFPIETKFADPQYAQDVYSRAVEGTLASGTTGAMYFATIHRDASEILCDIVEEKGQRAMVGKVCMNRNSFNGYQETTQNSLNESKLFIAGVQARKSSLLDPVITPRFVPSCDQELLLGLGDLAKSSDVRIQSHLSETLAEVAWVKELEPTSRDYTDVYRQAGLLTAKTVMAHCVHLSNAELNAMKEAQTGIAHCPNSNCSIRSGNMDVRQIQKRGIKVGLGTDCSAGYSPSMLDAMRGSASVTCLDRVVGQLDEGFQFDAIRIRLNSKAHPTSHLFGHETIEDMVHKFVFLGDDRNVVQVWVNGRIVKDLGLTEH